MYCEIPQNWKRNRVYSMCAMARCLPLGHLLPHFVVIVKIDSNKSSSLPSLQTKIIWVKHHALQESDTTLDDLINQCPHINTYILDRTVRILLMNENSLRNNSTVYPICPKKKSDDIAWPSIQTCFGGRRGKKENHVLILHLSRLLLN